MLSRFQTTPEHHCALSLVYAMKHWNVVRRPGMCCPWHTVLYETKQAIKLIARQKARCEALWSPFLDWQCHVCLCMNPEANFTCQMCSYARAEEEPDGTHAAMQDAEIGEQTFDAFALESSTETEA
eukprot:gnl/TRDRNA2_/TRDRNA2_176906_c4_seq3.p2 gnl/TRDRNA2_/TRDRNA2_176906_c4~~gnl/TRDRNA2_/TRDRNA2_176906_c4_seq3.p2  ORF type:complete len:126 (+),score=24.40 gnl/TRDRNA2_/TRDRNA2_176906_c4_seq3:127-504(+)